MLQIVELIMYYSYACVIGYRDQRLALTNNICPYWTSLH